MLKGFLKRNKDMSLVFKAKHLFWELVYAWQRAYRGYDDTDVFELNSNFVERMILILKDFRENNCTEFNFCLNGETDKIINRMIYCFENSDQDKMYDNEYKDADFDIENYDKVCAKAKQNLNEGFSLLSKHFDDLWY